MGKTFLITTLGCKVNQYDSGALAGMLRAKGVEPWAGGGNDTNGAGMAGGMDAGGAPDVVVINTCIVTAESERKSRQAVRRMKARCPGALVAVIGCYPQMYPQKASEFEGVDFTAGVSGHEALAERIADKLKRIADDGRTDNGRADGDLRDCHTAYSGVSGRTRAYVKIQDGCEKYCSYCVVPYVRGREKSRDLQEVLGEADKIIAAGAPEIVLTGTHISSYSYKVNDLGDIRLGGLIKEITKHIVNAKAAIRLRLSSLEPTIITPDFVSALTECREALCPHFHLSLQSGSLSVLRRMNRGYTPEDFYEAASLLREAFPDAGVTTDIIAGFPGETDGEFYETVEFCKKAGFSKMHAFPYSKRPGTRAAELPGHVAAQVKRARVKQLIALSDEMALSFHRGHIGKTETVLIEKIRNDALEGLTGNYIRVRAQAEGAARGAPSGIMANGHGHNTSLDDVFANGREHYTALNDIFANRRGHYTALNDIFASGRGHYTALNDIFANGRGFYIKVKLTGATPAYMEGEAVL